MLIRDVFPAPDSAIKKVFVKKIILFFLKIVNRLCKQVVEAVEYHLVFLTFLRCKIFTGTPEKKVLI